MLVLSLIVYFALGFYIKNIPKQLIEYDSSAKWGADGYDHISVYMNTGSGFSPNAFDKISADIDRVNKVDSIDTSCAIYSASCESNVTVVNGSRSTNATSTVYIGEYFKFHPTELVEGAYPSASGTLTDSLVIDELAAWQLFGTRSGVVGLEVNIGEDIYVVGAVAKLADGVYNDVYGDTPRIFINADSSAMRTQNVDRAFTAFDAMLPNPITNYAEGKLKDLFSSYNGNVINNDTAFGSEALSELRDMQTKLLTDSSDTEYPYTEKARLILALKASEIHSVQNTAMKLTLLAAVVIFCTLFGPTVKFVERMLAKIKF